MVRREAGRLCEIRALRSEIWDAKKPGSPEANLAFDILVIRRDYFL
jgi:hypothetical protein